MARPPQTSPAAFIEAALSFIDERGVDDLSLRSLGKHMEISHATIYRHFPNKDALISALIDHQLGAAIREADLTVPPQQRLRNLAVRLREHFDEHPNLLKPWINGTGAGENAFQISAMIVEGLGEMGISPPRLGHWLRILENFVIGGLVFDYAAAPHHLTIRSDRLNVLREAGSLPQEMTPQLVADQNRSAFEAALDVLLGAVAREGRRDNAA